MNMPYEIFKTPKDWGGEFYMDEVDMEENVAALRELGDEWLDITIEDCDKYNIDRILTDGSVVYRLAGIRDDHFFTFTKGHNGLYECQEWEDDENS